MTILSFMSLCYALALVGLVRSTSPFTCYYPGGAVDDTLLYQPCVSVEGQTSMCCALNRTLPYGAEYEISGTSDICLPNGLCKNEYVENGLSVTSYWHDLCTSKDWPEASCLQVYDNTTNSTFALTPCDGTENSEEWCYESNNTSCCGTEGAVTIASVLKDWATSTPQSSGDGLSTGAVAGVGVGAGVAGVVLGAAIMFFLVRRRQKVPSYSVPNDGGQVPVTKHLPEPAGSVADVHYNQVYETEAIGRHELPTDTDRR